MSASLYYLFLLFLSLYRNLPFVISVKVFLRGNCYALPLSYCRCIPSFCIGINLLLRTLMFEVLVCLFIDFMNFTSFFNFFDEICSDCTKATSPFYSLLVSFLFGIFSLKNLPFCFLT